MSSGPGFVISVIVYTAAIFCATAAVERSKRYNFLFVVTLFFLLYSVVAISVNFVFIDNPRIDFFYRDETKYYTESLFLSRLPLQNIWSTAFSQFSYSASSLYWAIAATIQHYIHVEPFYRMLFLRLNTAFWGSFIPGIVYLLCSCVTDKRRALKAAIAYGLLSFTLAYTVSLLRDVHVALVYAVGIYIAMYGKRNLGNLVALGLLGVAALFLRIENGLFFPAIIGVWFFRQGGGNKRMFAYAAGITCVAMFAFYVGIDSVLTRLFGTIQHYSTRSVSSSDAGALSVQLRKLPSPIDYLGLFFYGQIAPFPFWSRFTSGLPHAKSFYTLTLAIPGLYWFFVWARIGLNYKKSILFFKHNLLVSSVTLLYILAVATGELNPRRLMAVYPVIFLCYVYVSSRSEGNKTRDLAIASLVYVLFLVAYLVIKY